MPYKPYAPIAGSSSNGNNSNGTYTAAKMSAQERPFQVGDYVWAKMKGYPYWPGRISKPEDSPNPVKKGAHLVYFFGSRNYSSVDEADLKDYKRFGAEYEPKIKSVTLKRAAEEAADAWSGKLDLDLKPAKTPNKPPPKPQGSGLKLTPAKPKSKCSQPILHNDEMAEAEFEALLNSSCTGLENSGTKKLLASKRPAESNNKTECDSKKLKLKTELKSEEGNNGSQSPIVHAISEHIEETSKKLAFCKEVIEDKHIVPTDKIIGFIGLGIMGSGMVNNLLQSGHNVVVWNRTISKCDDFVRMGAKSAATPAEVIAECDVTFSCISDPAVVKEVIFGCNGVLSEINATKSYIEMTTIDAETSKDIAEAINLKQGRYLEAQIQGSKVQSQTGTLVILAAGDRTLFDDIQSCFKAVAKESVYLGEVGSASKMNLVLQTLAGVSLCGLAEAMALGDRAGLKSESILEIFELTNFCSSYLKEKCKAIIEGVYPSHHPLQLMQKDLRLGLNMGDILEQPLPVTAAANEIFKHAKRVGYGSHDASAVYIRARF